MKYRVCHVDELEHDQPRCYRVNGIDLFIVRHWAEIYALENRCGHMGAALHRGEFTDGLIVCALHGAAYDVRTGEKEWDAILPPPMAFYSQSDNPRLRQFGELIEGVETLNIKTFPVSVENDEVFLSLPPG